MTGMVGGLPIRSGMRRTPITRRMSTTRRASSKRMAAVRPILEERSAGCCDKCGYPLDVSCDGYVFHAHHRLSRARGGDDSPANLLCVHQSCHRVIHSRVSVSEMNGWILPSGSIPDEMVVSLRGDFAILAADGGVWWISDGDSEDPDGYLDSLRDDDLGVTR